MGATSRRDASSRMMGRSIRWMILKLDMRWPSLPLELRLLVTLRKKTLYQLERFGRFAGAICS